MFRECTLSKAVRIFIGVGAVTAASMATMVKAQENTSAPKMEDTNLEIVVVTGIRGAPRSVSDSPVPVDSFSEADINSVAQTDTNDLIKTLVPSYSVMRQPINDGGTFIRPASLRGMPTDKTLVLVNSKRRHRAALVEIGGSGTQGPDVATIPAAALKGIEVLRDGAAAQYGSDAIAGVINFQLKDNAEGGSFSVEGGEYFEGDGTQVTLTGNVGMPLGDAGFFSLSGEFSESDSTSRSVQYCETWLCLDPDSPLYDEDNRYTSDPDFMAAVAAAGDVVQPWGQPNTSALRLFFNSGYELGGGMKLYSFGNYSKSEADGNFYYRYPGNGTIENLRLADGSIYSPLQMYPGGFTPRFYGDVIDLSLTGGIQGEFANDVTYDISGRFGSSEIQYTIKNTLNPSMGPDTPKEFHPGDLINEEMQLSADFGKEYDLGLSSDVMFAYGLTYMEESYEVVTGDSDSYTAGPYAFQDPWNLCNGSGAGATPTAAGASVIAKGSTLNCTNTSDPVFRVVGVGSNGFPGYSPEYSGLYERDMYGAYIDLSADVTSELFLQGAMRFEDYSDFGSELVGKLASKYSLTDATNLRGSIGTGFRAPTPGQQSTTNVSTRVINGTPVATGLFPATSPVGAALGAEPLKPETSLNFTLGFTSDLTDSLNLTFDVYRIEVADRFYATSTQSVSTVTTSGQAYQNYLALVAANVSGAASIGAVNYYQNAFDSITQGADLVATYTMGNTQISGSFNVNKSSFDSDPGDFLNAEDQADFENGAPAWRGVFSVRHTIEDLTILTRANFYGAYENYNDGETQEFDPAALIDLEFKYDLTEMLSISLGGRNIFDTYPDEDKIEEECCGAVYWSNSEVDWQGGYYYARLNTRF